jgi:hypothetical protein
MQYLKDNWGKTEISNSLQVAKVSITASGTSTPVAADIPVGAMIIDAFCIAKATVTSGTAQVRVGSAGAAITAALVMAVEDALVRAATIDTTYSTVGADGIEVIAHSDADRGDVFILYKK